MFLISISVFAQRSHDRDAVKTEIARCRKQELAWPRFHLLWDLHPVMTWLTDTLQTTFGRHQAPVICLPHGQLADQEAAFLPLASNQSLT